MCTAFALSACWNLVDVVDVTVAKYCSGRSAWISLKITAGLRAIIFDVVSRVYFDPEFYISAHDVCFLLEFLLLFAAFSLVPYM
jgi:hypothetical protein